MTSQIGKPCRDCGVVKPLTDYHRNRAMPDGRLRVCKDCRREIVRRESIRRADKIKAYDRERNQRPERRQWRTDQCRKWRARNPEKYRAQGAVNNAVRDGRLIKPDNCQSCGATQHIHGHHDDYSKPLNVRWLCPSCHHEAHQ